MPQAKKKKQKERVHHQQIDSNHFFNRELSWLEFNSRVLNEAVDSRTPLLERLRFLSIYTSNLDEFVMKRVGGLKGQVASEYSFTSVDGLSPEEQLKKIREKVLKDNQIQENTFFQIKEELIDHNILLSHYKNLNDDQKKYCYQYFNDHFFPILAPLSVDSGKPFPFISNLSISFGIYLKHPFADEVIFSRVKVPEFILKWIEVPTNDNQRVYINSLEIIEHHLHSLYHGHEILDTMLFRVTRNADWEHSDEDTEDLLVLIEESINSRRLQEPIRIECLRSKNNEKMLSYLMKELKLTQDDLYFYDSNIDFLSLNSIADLNISQLKYKEWRPITPEWATRDNIFNKIKEKDRFVHHPYENFQSTTERLIIDASKDSNVLSIRMTLYRTEENSLIIKSLIDAAENGIQVVCLIELKARFDEKRNIYWAKMMEEAGVHVVYGIIGLKTHTKIAMIVRKEKDGSLLRYAHIGTGNYNSRTAKLYTDLSLFTVNKKLTSEINEVFNYLTGSSLKTNYENLIIAPVNAKSTFIKKIHDCIKASKKNKQIEIIAKMNSLEDTAITEALYKASQAGVKIVLIVRGFCCLRPGVKGLSDNIRVISIIGRFLEHSRIFYFGDIDKKWEGEFYFGSADWMHRNMHSRVEVITPIDSQEIKSELSYFLEILLKDRRSAWELLSNGSYKQFSGSLNSGTHLKMMQRFIKDKPVD